MQKDVKKMLDKHPGLTHSEMKKVTSHVQRETDGWYLNTVIVENCATPFRYKRRKLYRNLTGARVDMTYYPIIEQVAGVDMEFMKVVRIRRS
ncbi:MAG: hypothetical protein HKN70_04215 [Gammaproteobacteria bacterium]|nr:hypothetical protein [Gammaproteobacteria bacterium]